MFMFYTEDSNYFAGIVCLILAIFQINELINGKEIPKIIRLLKYVAVCLLMVTFTVVIFVLAPMVGGVDGYKMLLLNGSMLYQHLLCPIFALSSFVHLERKNKIPKNYTFISLIPTIIYAVIMIILNILKIIEGPYPFLMVYRQSILMSIVWFILILGGSFIFNNILRVIVNKLIKD